MLKQALFFLMIIVSSAGCAPGIGAKRLPIDRTAYIEALGTSWKEQVLYNIVKIRYGDAPTFLDVSSITQAYQLQAGSELQYTYSTGSVGGYGGPTNVPTTNVPPATAWVFPSHQVLAQLTAQYQTTPTVTYTPITGEALKMSLLEPIPTDDMCKALTTGWKPNFILPYIVQSINNLQNRPGRDNKFLELVDTWGRLRQDGALVVAFEEVAKAEAPAMEEKKGKPKGKADKWDETADSLAKFTSRLVKEQKKQCDEKTIAPFIILNSGRARNKIDVVNFKKYLGLLDDPNATNLVNRCKKLLNDKDNPFEKEELNLISKMGLNDSLISENKDELREFLGFPTGLTSQEQDKLQAIIKEKSLIEKYQVVSGFPPKEVDLSKIYLRTRSIFQVLILLSEYVDVPDTDIENNKVRKADEKWKEYFKGIKHLDIRCVAKMFRPNEFAVVKYKGNWFYIADTDPDSKDILSDMIGIFTMMPVGKPATAPVLTLPVR